mgnify:FL=1
MKELILIAIGAALVNNVVLSQFLGICAFLGVSKKNGHGGRHGRSGYFCPYDFLVCDKSDLQIYPGTGRT